MADTTQKKKTQKKRSEPMVVVHRADGTTEKVSLSELKRRRVKSTVKEQSQAMPASIAATSEPKTQALAKTTPVTEIFKDEAIAKGKKAGKESRPQPVVARKRSSVKKAAPTPLPKKTLRPQGNVTAFRSQMQTLSSSSKKSAMHDVVHTSPAKATMGPVEEIQTFSLQDFRRLAPRPKEAASKLIGKFHGYKEESFMLYMQTRFAWHQSELYKQYRDVAIQSLINSKTIDSLLSEGAQKKGMSYDEFHELVGVNMQLS